MKKIYLIIWTLILVVVSISCEKDDEAMLSTISVSSETFTPSYNSVLIETRFETTPASYYKPTLKTVYVQYSTRANFEEYEEALMNGKDYSYKVQLNDLQDNTTYYIRYVASNRYSSARTEEISEFKTLQPSVPMIILKSISDIWDTHAKAEIALSFDGGAPISEMGICWDTQTAPAVEKNKLSTKDTSAILDITSLQPNTKYYVRAYAKNKMGINYSEEKSFISLTSPEVQTSEVQNIPNTSAVLLSGILTFNGNDIETTVGFCWSEDTDPSISGNRQEVKAFDNAFTYQLSNLKDATLYYVCTYAKNKIGITYGNVLSFTTTKAMLPIVTTTSATNISYRSAKSGGVITNDGGAAITQCGVVYSKSPNPTIDNNDYRESEKDTCRFIVDLNYLSVETTYYMRAYAINRVGIAYGNERSFKTKTVPKQSVDLGLSVKWATFNVGASAPGELGEYFAWGETTPKDEYAYNWETYKWGDSDSLTKYNANSKYGIVDNKEQLDLKDDAARANWGGSWRMPTQKEWVELRDPENCIWEWTTHPYYFDDLWGELDMYGYKVTSKKNGNNIFLPVGDREHFAIAIYWTSTLYYYPWRAWAMWMEGRNGQNNVEWSDVTNRCDGNHVRPVCP